MSAFSRRLDTRLPGRCSPRPYMFGLDRDRHQGAALRQRSGLSFTRGAGSFARLVHPTPLLRLALAPGHLALTVRTRTRKGVLGADGRAATGEGRCSAVASSAVSASISGLM